MFASLRAHFLRVASALSAWAFTHRRSLLALLVIGLAFPVLAYAQSTDPACELRSFNAIGCINYYLLHIVKFLGSILLFLLDIFIQFAQYNGFRSAFPVEIGWTVVRDVVNMFFIIVLLVSAFATIIGYRDEFHYTRVLPKLLLMAVLINFSRTILALGIDFSQVVMLTFVNAFKDAAAGNFVNGFGLNGAMQFRPGSEAAAQASVDQMKLFITILLAIVCIGIMIMTVLAMIAFVLVRILGLWMLMIFSPVAFFATALPGKLQDAVSAFTSDFWRNYSGYLVSGPVMAFFLYITLATIQRASAANGGRLGEATGLMTSPSTSGFDAFASQLGNVDTITTFIVSIAMMWMGLQAAGKTAGALPGFDRVNGLLQSLPKRGLQVGAVAGGVALGAAALAGRGVQRGAGLVNQRYGLTTKATAAVGKAGLAVPGVRSIAGGTLAKMAGAEQARIADRTKDYLANARGLKNDPEALYRYRKSLGDKPEELRAKEKIDAMLKEKGIDFKQRMAEEEAKWTETKQAVGAKALEIAKKPGAYAAEKVGAMTQNRADRKYVEEQADAKYAQDVRAINKEYDGKVAGTALESEKKQLEVERLQKLDGASKEREATKAAAVTNAADIRKQVEASLAPAAPGSVQEVSNNPVANKAGSGAKTAEAAKATYEQAKKDIDSRVKSGQITQDDAKALYANADREYKVAFKAALGKNAGSPERAQADVSVTMKNVADAESRSVEKENASRKSVAQTGVMIEDQKKNLAASYDEAKTEGNAGKVKEVEMTMKVKPHLAPDAEFGRVMSEIKKDVAAQAKLDPEALKQTVVLDYFIEPHITTRLGVNELDTGAFEQSLSSLDSKLQAQVKARVQQLKETGELKNV